MRLADREMDMDFLRGHWDHVGSFSVGHFCQTLAAWEHVYLSLLEQRGSVGFDVGRLLR